MRTLSELFGEKSCPCCGGKGNDKPLQHTAAEDAGVYRGMSIVLPPHIHQMIHDPEQPHAARAHLLLSEIRKQKEGHQGEEATGAAGGLGSFWTPSRTKAEEYATQSGFQAYREHEREHNCGDPDYGDGGCPTTRVIVHAQTPPEKHHWTEVFRPGEKYDPEISWRLPIRPGTPMRVRGISWREGQDNLPSSQRYSEEGMKAEKLAPYHSHDFLREVRKSAGANGDLPEGLTFSHREQGGMHTVLAHPGGDKSVSVGSLSWHAHERPGPDPEDGWCETCEDEYPVGHHSHPAGEVDLIQVTKGERRKGIASAMWNYAHSLDVTPKPVHSADQSEDGKSWARTTAAYVTPGTMGKDNEGHRVQMTTMDGWAHDDGSHGHEDNTNIGDHPVYTQDHTWLPNGRYWGPNSAQNDQRIFEGDHLKPSVREDLLGILDSFMRPRYRQWPLWTKAYFAGSQAARWLDESGRGNGDFDMLIGIDFDKFRQYNPSYAGDDDEAIAKMLTDGMHRSINDDAYHPPV